jgi:hypothetical protein
VNERRLRASPGIAADGVAGAAVKRGSMRIGISVLTHAGQNIWENGLGQNVFHLGRLFRSLPFVDDVILLNCGDQAELGSDAAPGAPDFPLLALRDATDRIDVAIELAGGLDVEWLDYIRARGKKVVFHVCGQPYAALIEPAIFGKPGFFSRADRCDEVWVLPKDAVFMPMLGALHRCPVFEVPFVWSPQFLERRAEALAELGFPFGFTPMPAGGAPRPLRAAIFEPNISVTKASSIPMLICDEAYRRNPQAVREMRVLNTIQMKDHLTFAFLFNSLNIVKDGKALADQRHDFVGYMAQYADLVVSHQWRNPQNILYLDALYGGYPLVHNSPWLENVGYYYPDSNIDAGAEQLISAWAGHDANFEVYQSRARRFLASLSPLTAANQERYARQLLLLDARKSGAKAA